MNFWKMFSASMLAWIVGIVGIFVFAIGSLVSSLLNMNMGEVGIKEESVLYINIGEPITDAPSSSPLSGFDPMSMPVTESLSLLKVLTAVEQAATDDNIKGICIYADGVASVEGIDTAMKLGANHPMGPLALGDLIGLDICLAIMDVLFEETHDNKYAASPLLRKMVRGKRLGVKTGIGFYDYSNGPRNKVPTDKK